MIPRHNPLCRDAVRDPDTCETKMLDANPFLRNQHFDWIAALSGTTNPTANKLLLRKKRALPRNEAGIRHFPGQTHVPGEGTANQGQDFKSN